MTRQTLINNISWLMACFALSFVVWIVATIQSDPIIQQTFSNIPVQIDIRDGYILADTPRVPNVRVIVRGQRSAISLLTSEDIVVSADLTQTTGGTQTIPLRVTVNRRGVFTVDTQPTQLTLLTEQVVAEQRRVEISVSALPPVDYTYEAPTSDILQATVSGGSSDVANVTAVRAEIDLTNQRNPFVVETVLVPINASGSRVFDVTVEPRSTRVRANIYPRDDVRQLAVRPDIRLATLETGYMMTSIAYNPQIIYVSGDRSVLETLGSTVDTEEISLANQTQNFTTQVSLILPPGVVILGDQSSIQVTIGIVAQNSARQIDNVPVEIIGLSAGLQAVLTPDSVSVVLSGPVTLIDAVQADQVRAIVDLNNVPIGNSEIQPQIIIDQGQTTLDTTLIPAAIGVTILDTTPAPEATPTPEATPAD
jgi:YbbR domain-containing protein